MRWELLERHPHWNDVLSVYKKLTASGYQALLAGGCVRDLLLGRVPHDFDIATSATPDDVERLFPRAVMVGKAFGVAMIPFEGFQIEVATFREDGEYKDGRRPESVKFSSAKEDAYRRDFTINAMFIEPGKHEILDFVGGEHDLGLQEIKTVGESHRRFSEDYLRVLRAIRFSAQLDFRIELDTWENVKKFAPKVASVSRERIRDEFLKLLRTKNRVRGLALLESSGLLEVVIPIFSEFSGITDLGMDLWTETKLFVGYLDGETDERLLMAALLFPWMKWEVKHEEGLKAADFRRKAVGDLLSQLKFSNHVINHVEGAIASVLFLEKKQRSISQWRRQLASPWGDVILGILRLQDHTFGLNEYLDRALALGVQSLPEPFLDGSILKSLGVEEGRRMGLLLEEAMDLQLEGRLLTREAALDWLKTKI